jgi:hypothetical protein
MIDALRNAAAVLTLAATCTVLPAIGPARADANAAIRALQHTPVSLFTIGLNALSEGVNAYIGRGGTPAPSAMFAAPLSGPIGDLATILYDEKTDTIVVNVVKIKPIATELTPDDICRQGLASLRLLAGLDPATGQLQAGATSSQFAGYFTATGTPTTSPADDLVAVDKAFSFRFVFATEAGHFDCRAPLFGTSQTIKKMAF